MYICRVLTTYNQNNNKAKLSKSCYSQLTTNSL